MGSGSMGCGKVQGVRGSTLTRKECIRHKLKVTEMIIQPLWGLGSSVGPQRADSIFHVISVQMDSILFNSSHAEGFGWDFVFTYYAFR